MRPKAIIAAGLISTLLAGPTSAGPAGSTGSTGSTGSAGSAGSAGFRQDQAPPQENLQRIREAVSREPAIRIENGQLKIYVEVIGNWPTFAEATKGYDFLHGPTGKGANPMSHQEFLAMVTPQDVHSSELTRPDEVLQMALVNVVGQWAISKALAKIGNYRKNKQMRDIQAQIDAELAAIRKDE